MTAKSKDILIVPVAVVVLLVWAASAMAGFLTGKYASLTVTTPVMLLLAGYVFGVSIVRKGDK